MKRYTYTLDNGSSKNQQKNKKIDLGESIFLFIHDKYFKISKKEEAPYDTTIKFKLLNKSPFTLFRIEDDIYLVEVDKVPQVKKYIYKNFINKEIYMTYKVDPLTVTDGSLYHFSEGLQINEFEFLNVKDLKSIEEYKISKIKKDKKNSTKKDFKIINISTFENMLNEIDKIEHVKRNINQNIQTNNFNMSEVREILFSMSKKNENKEKLYYDYKYENLEINKNYLIINYANYKKFVNTNDIVSMDLEEETIELYYQDPFGKDIKYKIYIKKFIIHTPIKDYKLYCFRDDYLRNNPFKFNNNKTLIEI